MVTARLAVQALAEAALNPAVFLAYLLLAAKHRLRGIEPTGQTNVYRMIPGYYLAFAAAVFAGRACCVVLLSLLEYRVQRLAAPDLGVLLFSSLSAPAPSALSGLRWLAYAGTALVAWVWVTGMEGNIMGFIGFPILLLGILFYVVATARSWPLWHFAALFSPTRLVCAQRLWIQFIYFALAANPFFWYLVKDAGAKAPAAASARRAALVPAMSILYAAWLAANWGLLKLSGAGAPWQSTLTVYFAQTRAASGVIALGLILIAAAAQIKRLSTSGANALGRWPGAALAVLMALQSYAALRAFLGTRQALRTDSAAAAP